MKGFGGEWEVLERDFKLGGVFGGGGVYVDCYCCCWGFKGTGCFFFFVLL